MNALWTIPPELQESHLVVRLFVPRANKIEFMLHFYPWEVEVNGIKAKSLLKSGFRESDTN